MKQSILLFVLLMAGLSVVAAPIVSALAGPSKTHEEADEMTALKTMPLSYVIDTALLPEIFQLRFADDKTQALAKISDFQPELRNLFWLSFFKNEIPSGQMHQFFTRRAEERKGYAEAEKLMKAQGQEMTDEVRQQLADMSDKADPSRYADDVVKALTETGLTRQTKAFKMAQTLAAAISEADFTVLDIAFGSNEALQADIEAYVMRTPALVEWSLQARVRMSDEDRLRSLTTSFNSMDEAGIDRLSKPLKQIFVVDYFNAEMLNGSVHQFFYNHSGQYAPDVVAAFREIGLPKHADAVQRGIDMFSTPYPTDTQERRELHFGKGWSEWDDRLAALTGDVDDGEILPALIALAKRENMLPR